MPSERTTPIRVAMVDVYVLRQRPAGLEALVLRRAQTGRSPGSWECVHGHIDDGETPVQAALRELAEETGMTAMQLYNLSQVEMFYSHRLDYVALIPSFAVFVEGGEPVLGGEHDGWEWLGLPQARERVSWPRLERGLDHVATLLSADDAGALEDVLRIE
jgi:dATP pyrophosphohydrolase